MFGLSFWELAMILVVALLVLGPKRLPGLAKSVGKGLRELRKASSDLRSAIEEPLEEVRRPLEDLRSDLADTVHNIEAEVEREARLEQGEADTRPNPYEEQAGQPTEVEDRRREVEQMYAAAAREDVGGEGEEAKEAEGDLWEPQAAHAQPNEGPEHKEPSKPARPDPKT